MNPLSVTFIARNAVSMANRMLFGGCGVREQQHPDCRHAQERPVMNFRPSAPAPLSAASDDGRSVVARGYGILEGLREPGVSGGTIRNRLILAFLIWGGVLPPAAAGLSDCLEDDMLGLMVGSALRAMLPLSLPRRA
jgi:hypothetical protein